MKDRQLNSQKKQDKQRYKRHTHRTKDRVTRTTLRKSEVNSSCTEG